MASRLFSGSRWAARRQIGDRSLFPARSLANGSAFTQLQGYYCFTPMSDVSDPSFVFGNFARTAPGTAVDGPGNYTIRLGLYDGVNTYPIYWPDGQRDRTIVPGGQSETEPLFGVLLKKGRRYAIVRLMTYAAAPGAFPAGDCNIYQVGPNKSEWGSALTDKTLTPTTITTTIETYFTNMHLAVKGTTTAKMCVGILADSIVSGLGMATQACFAQGVPCIDIGISGMSLGNFLTTVPGATAKLAKQIQASGVTHVLCTLWVNDLLSGATAAQMYANLVALKAILDPIGVKLITCRPQPKTNASNNGENSAGQFATRRALDALVVANNGVGYGYVDFTVMADPSGDLWRSDAIWATGATIDTGGTGFATDDTFFADGYSQARVSAVSSGAVTGVVFTGSFAQQGGWLPGYAPGKVIRNWGPWGTQAAQGNGYGFSNGTGLQFTLTTATPGSPTVDGTHPQNATQYAMARPIEDWLIATLATFPS
jgi:hypothetical protein